MNKTGKFKNKVAVVLASFILGLFIGCIVTSVLAYKLRIEPLRSEISVQQAALAAANKRAQMLTDNLAKLEDMKFSDTIALHATIQENNRAYVANLSEILKMKERLSVSFPLIRLTLCITAFIIVLLIWLCYTHASDNKLIAAANRISMDDYRIPTVITATKVSKAELSASEEKFLEDNS